VKHPPDETIEVRIEALPQLFNSFDPSPFHVRDIDRDAEEFIVGRARELPRHARFVLLVHIGGSAGADGDEETVRSAVHEHFAGRALNARRRLRLLFQTGRISLVIGLLFLGGLLALGNFVVPRWIGGGLGAVARESLFIGGWVAMWRPLEIFLYDWWPIRADARLFDRLAAMPVTLRQGTE
jgi:hypothetical protein